TPVACRVLWDFPTYYILDQMVRKRRASRLVALGTSKMMGRHSRMRGIFPNSSSAEFCYGRTRCRAFEHKRLKGAKVMELGLANKTALVTGGSKGIGLETARALAREGVKVLICSRRESALAEAARDILRTTNAKIETQPLDVTKVEQIE